ncbi:AraC family transcriptional regulator [Flavobacteriaceae bacterium]|jgi:effector-binding domain-containing protein|nr:AraC family transcriptional regulator [Flavobacteriaceae bacterium]MDA9992800.1 AraC family transcriptional regulator [Flavobacteriaceae bacterium]MDB2336219.1 AraC family transcriptional regulator [Flavobacteriaceae bacterium]MDB2418064.1 AraC family transcriptional regulator [Flavobacteriaceae bacterium]MDB2625162.1 AraC family transcriptional regulator [Flavobacteriaceae bacterium]|tara:strand:- start:1135 stop:2025 length:891 start_codon:yes stop_codon:yes gene_type:complete
MKKFSAIIGFLTIGFLLWYLIIKPYDYLVTFKVKTSAGTINQTIKLWNTSIANLNPVKQENIANLSQQIEVKDSIHNYKWSISSLNDSISKVNVYVTDEEHSFANRISIPFGTTDFEKRIEYTVTDFIAKLKEHLKKIKVTVVGKDTTRSTYAAYISVKGLQIEKARGMMQNYSLLTSVLSAENIEMNGTPFVEITNWNIQNDSIAYNFCFPVIKSDSLPIDPRIQYKQYNGVKALKATYNGNYITSDRAWYALLDYADNHDIVVDKKPLEVFYSNPNFGGDELQWEAEIFMPVIE